MIKLIDLIKEEDNKIIIPRNMEGRKEKHLQIIYQQIQDYIKAGSNGDLMLKKTLIETLPNNLKKVGGDLNLSFSKIETLPDNLHVAGDLNLIHTPITTLPNNLQVDGVLNLINSSVKTLSSNLQVGKALYLNDTQVKSLPSNLQVGDLDLYHTMITTLPDNLQIKGNLELKRTPIAEKYSKEEIRKMIEDAGGFVKGNIYI